MTIEFKSARMTGEGIFEVSAQETMEKSVRGEIKVIDVRRPDEFKGELGHVKGAQLVTLETEFMKAIDTWPKGENYVFVCRSGGRSGNATGVAKSKGFEHVFNMEGGMINWNRLGLPTEK